MGIGSSGRYEPPGYSPFGTPEEVLIHLLLADEKVKGPEGRSTLSTSFRKLVQEAPPFPIDDWKRQWHLDSWSSESAEIRFEELLVFLYFCAKAAEQGEEYLPLGGNWCKWLPGFSSQPSATIQAAGAWMAGQSWTSLLKAALGEPNQKARFHRLWQGENPGLDDNSGDALAMGAPGARASWATSASEQMTGEKSAIEPLVLTWSPFVETRSRAKDRLHEEVDEYLNRVEAVVKKSAKKTRPGLKEDHLEWLARRLIRNERPVDTAATAFKNDPTPSEISRVRSGQKSIATLIGLVLKPARPGPRRAL